MCRLFGQISLGDDSVQHWMLNAERPFVGWSQVHRHGWGICWYEDGAVRVEKEPVPALGAQKFNETAKGARSHLFICHLRKATIGKLSYVNSQPFTSGDWAFAHNGSLGRKSLLAKLNSVVPAVEGETDSEVYFRWLLQGLETGGVDGLRSGIKEARTKEFTALNFLLSDGHTLYAYWEQSPAAKVPYPEYYQLYYREIIKPRGAVIVSSERLDSEEWLRIPHKSLLIVSERLDVRVDHFL
jgi:predicted glutamine amidotransferase